MESKYKQLLFVTYDKLSFAYQVQVGWKEGFTHACINLLLQKILFNLIYVQSTKKLTLIYKSAKGF